MKYSPPTPTRMLVAMAEALSPVMKVIPLAIVRISNVPGRPALPSTQPNRRYIMTPRIVRTLGVNTPRKVPNFCCVWGEDIWGIP